MSSETEDWPMAETRRPRTLARYYAFNVLFQINTTNQSVERCLAALWRSDYGEYADDGVRRFAEQLVGLATGHLDTIDGLIEQYARQRALHRLPMVDLALLQLGCAELLYVEDVPPAVTINEVVELAKEFSTEESAPFINAVLDRVRLHQGEVPGPEKVSSQWGSSGE